MVVKCIIMNITIDEKAFKTILREGLLDKLYMAHIPSDKEIPNPTVSDVIERNGWIINSQRLTKSGRGTLFQIEQKTGAFGNVSGTLNLDELINDIKEFGKVAGIVRREGKSNDRYNEAEKAIIYVRN